MSVALYTGVSGLLAHQRRLDVVAANIANINTVGYRSSRVIFQDLFSTTLHGGSGAVGGFGGINPQQVGLGVGTASIDVDHGEGSLINTGISSDLAIQGNGFFILYDGTETSYTRDGSFKLNADGVLVDPSSGRRVQGWLADDLGVVDTEQPIADMVIPLGSTALARASTNASMIGNLEANAASGTVVTRTVQLYDSLGTPRDVLLTLTKEATPANTWTYAATFEGTDVGTGTLSFNSTGILPDGTTAALDIPAALLNTTGAQPDDLAITLDFSDVTQLAIEGETGSDISLQNQDGYPIGVLQSFTVGGNGEVTGVYDNGLRRDIGQIAVAGFANVGGLAREGDNGFVETSASGVAQIGPANSGGRGVVSGGVLENSNVDLGEEFSNLIVTQRGFQANSRTITAADTLLQETVNLIR